MHRALALLDLAVMLASATGSLAGRSRYWGWPLLLASALWLPLNNGILEGRILVALNGDHGLTVADVVGVTGAIAGGLRLWPPWPGRSRGWLAARAFFVAAVVLAGFIAALLFTDERVQDRLHLRDRAPRVSVERAVDQPAGWATDDGRRPSGATATT